MSELALTNLHQHLMTAIKPIVLLLSMVWLASGCKPDDLSGSHQAEERFYQQLFGLLATPDGGYLLGVTRYHAKFTVNTTTDLLHPTYTYDPTSTYADLMAIKTDASGNPQWTKVIEKPDDQIGTSLLRLPSGNYLLAGNVSNKALTLQDVILVELSHDGAEQTIRQLAKPGTGLTLNELKVGPSGDLVGVGQQAKSGSLTRNQVDWITRLSPDGSLTRWTLTASDSTNLRVVSAFDLAPDGSLLIASQNYVNNTLQAYFRNISADGVLRWTQTVTSVRLLTPRQLYATADGGFLLAGSALSASSVALRQVVVIKVDAGGRTQSVQWFDTGSYSYDYEHELLHKRTDGTFILATWKSDGLLSLTLLDTNGSAQKTIPTTIRLDPPKVPVLLPLAGVDVLLAELTGGVPKDITLHRIGPDGNEIWQRTITDL